MKILINDLSRFSTNTKVLFCIGAEKSGTTWLYSQICKHPKACTFGKELNVLEREIL